MFRTVVVGAVGAAVLAGTGAGAFALSSAASPSNPGSSTATSATAAPTTTRGSHRRKNDLWAQAARRAVQGSAVVRGRDGAYTEVVFARGTATISPASLSVATADGHTVSFTLTASTKYHVRADKKTITGSSTSVHDGDTVVVLGRAPAGASTTAATQVLDLGPRS